VTAQSGTIGRTVHSQLIILYASAERRSPIRRLLGWVEWRSDVVKTPVASMYALLIDVSGVP
jgi:hypothetical protein